MSPTTQVVTFDGDMLRRGFWLYVWEVRPPSGAPLYYVGRTGDSSSTNAQSPFVRMGQHLGFLSNSSMLRNHLKGRKVEPRRCCYRMVAHGPILREAKTTELHNKRRNVVAALERELADGMTEAGYDVMNKVNSQVPVNKKLLARVRAAFAEHFPALQNRVAKAKSVRSSFGNLRTSGKRPPTAHRPSTAHGEVLEP